MSAEVMPMIEEASPRPKARTAGFFWLMTILTGRMAEARQSYANAQKLAPDLKDLSEALKRVSRP